MKYTIFFLVLFFNCQCMNITAQSDEILKIRETYYEYNKRIEEQGDDSARNFL